MNNHWQMASRPSKTVTSSQTGPHQNLLAVVRRQQQTRYGKPIAEHTQRAFDAAREWLQSEDAPLMLDAGCGTGVSTAQLAERYPDYRVVGVDRSEHRLERSGHHGLTSVLGHNGLLVRADLVDWWRLVAEQGIRFAKTWLLYPNPYPKPGQLQRRWHAHAIFGQLLAGADSLELRTNWQLYAQEFAIALSEYDVTATVEPWVPDAPLTPFERKYSASGHPLYRIVTETLHGLDRSLSGV